MAHKKIDNLSVAAFNSISPCIPAHSGAKQSAPSTHPRQLAAWLNYVSLVAFARGINCFPPIYLHATHHDPVGHRSTHSVGCTKAHKTILGSKTESVAKWMQTQALASGEICPNTDDRDADTGQAMPIILTNTKPETGKKRTFVRSALGFGRATK